MEECEGISRLPILLRATYVGMSNVLQDTFILSPLIQAANKDRRASGRLMANEVDATL